MRAIAWVLIDESGSVQKITCGPGTEITITEEKTVSFGFLAARPVSPLTTGRTGDYADLTGVEWNTQRRLDAEK